MQPKFRPKKIIAKQPKKRNSLKSKGPDQAGTPRNLKKTASPNSDRVKFKSKTTKVLDVEFSFEEGSSVDSLNFKKETTNLRKKVLVSLRTFKNATQDYINQNKVLDQKLETFEIDIEQVKTEVSEILMETKFEVDKKNLEISNKLGHVTTKFAVNKEISKNSHGDYFNTPEKELDSIKTRHHILNTYQNFNKIAGINELSSIKKISDIETITDKLIYISDSNIVPSIDESLIKLEYSTDKYRNKIILKAKVQELKEEISNLRLKIEWNEEHLKDVYVDNSEYKDTVLKLNENANKEVLLDATDNKTICGSCMIY